MEMHSHNFFVAETLAGRRSRTGRDFENKVTNGKLKSLVT